ncbi:AMP-binding protein [Staphylococcus sp. IVB6181]|uniref:AMP-binding protein n=1 Tax=Staphylococcus sp. IVB6181 TaxID=2929481 RepID=UPI0021D292FB|nr:AMP-binding protein [Staphylococcus sp. IVB6181]UXV35336.1 AMP-binding protein [Staphylococcus sp. IVB6181]
MSLNVVQTEASRLTQSELNHYLKSDVPFIQQWAAHERIGILIQDPAQFMRVYQAIQGAGYLPVVLDSKWTSEQLHEILAHYQVTQVIADKQIEDVHTVRLEQLNEAEASEELHELHMPPDGLLHIGFTSGTTGMPKAYYRNRHSWDVSYDANDAILETKPSCIIAPGPLAHSLTLYAMMYAYHSELTCYMQMDYHPVQLLHQLQEQNGAAVFIVPSVLEQLLHFDAKQLSEVSVTFLSSGAKLEPHTIQKFKQKLPNAQVIEFFGTSEASFISYHHVTDYAPKNVGKLFKGVKVILTDDSGKQLPDSKQVGQLHVQSEMVFSGYVGAESISSKDTIATGDYARMTDDQELILEGRVNNKVIVGGMNVYPEEVERVITETTPIQHVMVNGVPHYELGEVLIAYYQSETDLEIREVKQILRNHLERYKVPMRFIRVPEMLWTSSGKVARQQMIEKYGRQS